MAGYQLEFKRKYTPAESHHVKDYLPTGSVLVENVVDYPQPQTKLLGAI